MDIKLKIKLNIFINYIQVLSVMIIVEWTSPKGCPLSLSKSVPRLSLVIVLVGHFIFWSFWCRTLKIIHESFVFTNELLFAEFFTLIHLLCLCTSARAEGVFSGCCLSGNDHAADWRIDLFRFELLKILPCVDLLHYFLFGFFFG